MAGVAVTLGVPGDLASPALEDSTSKRKEYSRAGGAGLVLPASAAAALELRGRGEARCRLCRGATCVPVAQCLAAAARGEDSDPCLLLAMSCVHARCNRNALGWRALRIQKKKKRGHDASAEEVPMEDRASPSQRSGAASDPFSMGCDGEWLCDDEESSLDNLEEDLAQFAFESGVASQTGRRRKDNPRGNGPWDNGVSERAVLVPLSAELCNAVNGEGTENLGQRGEEAEGGCRGGLSPLPSFYIVPCDEPGAAKKKASGKRDDGGAAQVGPATSGGDNGHADSTANASTSGETWTGEEYERSDNDQFEKFVKRVNRMPEQCLRYCAPDSRPLQILWPDGAGCGGSGPADGFRCIRCGGSLDGEMQIMPQYQHYMLESIEWSRYPTGEEEGQEDDPLERLEAEILKWEWSTVAVLGCQSCHDDNFNREIQPLSPGEWRIAELDVVVVGEGC